METLTILNDVYVWKGGFASKHLPKDAGFRWDPANKLWWTKDAEKAMKLSGYADDRTLARIMSAVQRLKEDIAASMATDADLDIPSPEGLEYLPYQKGGIAFSQGREGTLIADEMGLGKTIQAIGRINVDPSIKRALIVCPASLKINWKRELDKWLTRPMTVGIADSKTWPTGMNVVVINYDILTKCPQVLAEEWDFVCFDESHYIKNEKAKRTKVATAIKARSRMALTGTPILNRPIELFTTLNWLDPSAWGSFWSFARKYAGAYQDRYGWHFDGASNLDELQKQLRSTVMVRRLKADVLKELPAKRRQVVELVTNGAAKVVTAERKAWEASEERMADLQTQADLAREMGDEAAYREAVKELSSGRLAAFAEMSKLRHETALAKVEKCIEFLTDALENGGKIVVFAHHLDVIEALKAGLAAHNPVVVTGSTKVEDRQRAVDAFQNDPSVKLFLGNIKAAGVGLTLTASSHVVFVELDWTPGWVSQAEDRCHRIGQTDSVLVQHLVLDGSLDAYLAKTLIKKQEVAEKALDGGANVDETIFDVVSFKEPEKKSSGYVMTEDQIDAVMYALRALSSVCDGAAEKDFAGFNAFDSKYGKQLATLPVLTQGQAKAAGRMLMKYKRQLGEEVISRIKGRG